jgi:hypothetical protein
MYFLLLSFHPVKASSRKIKPAGRWVALIALCALSGAVAASAQSVIAAADLVKTQGKPTAVLLHSPPSGPAKFFPQAELHRGLHGVAYTVFEGVKPEPMEVEILGVLNDAIGPGQDMILARLLGKKAEYTGVVAGMSGSPVYIDGRLVGAISYRIGQFSKDPIAGITPIQQMLQVRDRPLAPEMEVAQDQAPQSNASSPGESAQPSSAMAAGGEVQPIATPLVFGGFSRDAVTRFGDKFRTMGLDPVAGLGGAAAAGARQPEPLVPGSAVSAILVRGDLSISGTCTVTYVDPTRLLACGHPITQFGQVSMPMTKAEVVTTLASPMDSFKIINTTETVGSFTEDRASAIMGRFGVQAKMIPVSVEVVPTGRTAAAGADMRRVSDQIGGALPPQTRLPSHGGSGALAHPDGMHFEVLNNRELTPSAMLVSVYQSLSGTNESANQMSYRMDGELTLKGLPPVKLEGIMSPSETSSGAATAAMYVSDRFSKLYSDTLDQPEVTGLRLKMEEIPERHTAVLEGARLSTNEASAGDTVEVETTLHPYGSDAQVVRTRIHLPETLTAGPLRIVVGDGATLDRLTNPPSGAGHAAASMALADAVAQLNHSHANDRIYVALLDHDPQAQLESQALPAIPISMANVLEPLKAAQKVQLTGESVVEAGSVQTNYAVSGSQVLTLEIR